MLNKNIEDNNIKNIVPVKKSLGNIVGERSLYLSGSNFQGITSDQNFREYDEELKVQETTIDRFVEENDLNVGFIIVDVEGAELDLLEGARNTIISQKPILTISIYHRLKDFTEIIPWIANLNLGYEFKRKNIDGDQITGFKFTGGYNLHPFIGFSLDKGCLEFLKEKDIIDAGAFTGDTSLPLSKLTRANVYALNHLMNLLTC